MRVAASAAGVECVTKTDGLTCTDNLRRARHHSAIVPPRTLCKLRMIGAPGYFALPSSTSRQAKAYTALCNPKTVRASTLEPLRFGSEASSSRHKKLPCRICLVKSLLAKPSVYA